MHECLVISVQQSEAQGVRCYPFYEGCGHSVDGVSAVANNRECPAPLHRLHLLWLSCISERTWCCLRLPPLSTRRVASSWLKSPQLEHRFLPLCVPYPTLPSSRKNVRANTCWFGWGWFDRMSKWVSILGRQEKIIKPCELRIIPIPRISPRIILPSNERPN